MHIFLRKNNKFLCIKQQHFSMFALLWCMIMNKFNIAIKRFFSCQFRIWKWQLNEIIEIFLFYDFYLDWEKLRKFRVSLKYKWFKYIILLGWVFFNRSSGIYLLHLSVHLCTAIILINVNICTLWFKLSMSRYILRKTKRYSLCQLYYFQSSHLV